jgi:hypothetical protein
MISISVCIPTTGLCRSEHTLSLVNLGLYFMQHPLESGQEQTIIFRHYQSSSISNGRESLVRSSLADGASHVLFIDDDVGFDMDVLHGLYARHLPLVACNYRIRFEGAGFAAMTPDLTGRIETTVDSPELEPCGATGFGMALIAREVFEALPHPWFPQDWCSESLTYTTEDLPFFLAASAAGFTPMIDHVASRKLIHVGSYRYRWNDPHTPQI